MDLLLWFKWFTLLPQLQKRFYFKQLFGYSDKTCLFKAHVSIVPPHSKWIHLLPKGSASNFVRLIHLSRSYAKSVTMPTKTLCELTWCELPLVLYQNHLRKKRFKARHTRLSLTEPHPSGLPAVLITGANFHPRAWGRLFLKQENTFPGPSSACSLSPSPADTSLACFSAPLKSFQCSWPPSLLKTRLLP